MGLQKASGKASKKNVAKFLRDEKTSAFDKENTWVLVSDGRIVWVVGHRLDERFKLEDKTTHVLTICKK
jgi:tRNA(Ile)-lysidine synthase